MRPRVTGPTSLDPGWRSGPPDIVVHAPGGELVAHRGSYCWSVGDAGQCADAVCPSSPTFLDVWGADEVTFSFPQPGFTFQADFAPLESIDPDGDGCFHTRTTVPDCWLGRRLHPRSDGTGEHLRRDPVRRGSAGRPGRDVRLDHRPGRGRDGHRPPPSASPGTLHGEVDGGHGLNLSVSGLARTPKQASATVTATAANGKSVTVDAGKAELGCPATGTVSWWESDASRKQEVVSLGPAPYVYDVTLVLDGVEHHASATWPDDHVEDPFNDDSAPVPLVFDPPLEVTIRR